MTDNHAGLLRARASNGAVYASPRQHLRPGHWAEIRRNPFSPVDGLRERHPCRAGFAQIAKHHRLHGDSRTPFIGNTAPTGYRARIVPALKHGAMAPNLFHRVLGNGASASRSMTSR